jgi:hypothetical protein
LVRRRGVPELYTWYVKPAAPSGTGETGASHVTERLVSSYVTRGEDGAAGAGPRGTAVRFETAPRRPRLLTPTLTYVRRPSAETPAMSSVTLAVVP